MPDLATIVKLAYALGVDEDVMYSAMRRAVGRLPHVAAVRSDPDELAAMGHMLNLILPDAQVIGFESGRVFREKTAFRPPDRPGR